MKVGFSPIKSSFSKFYRKKVKKNYYFFDLIWKKFWDFDLKRWIVADISLVSITTDEKKPSHNSHSHQNFNVENNHFPPPWITFINGVQIKSKCTKKPDTQRVRSCTAKSCQKRIFMKAFGKVFALSYSPKGIFVGY